METMHASGADDADALRDFFENGGIGVQIVAPDGRLLSANRTALEMLGCASEDFADRTITDFTADADVAEDILLKLSRGEKLEKYPARLVGLKGEVRDVLITSSPRTQNGRVVDTRCFLVDVTRKAAGDPFDADGARLSHTYERAAVGLSEASLDGRLLRVNATVCAITGYSREELLGKSFFDLTVPEDREKDEEFYRRHIAGEIETYRFEKRLRRKDGVKVWVSVRSTLVRDEAGRMRYTVRAIQDISRRKIVEQKLLESERHTRELLESLPVAVYTTDADGRLTFYNKAAETLAGRTPQIGVDEWSLMWRLYWPDGTPLPLSECPMAIALKEDREVRGIEIIGERPDGTRIPLVPFPTPLRDGDGKTVGAINVLIDLSERRQAEANQRILLKELNHRVKNNMQMLYSLLRSAERESVNVEARAALAEATHRVGAIAAAQRVLYDVGTDVRFDANNFFETICASARQTLVRAIVIDMDAIAPVQLPNDSAMPLALIMNELLTNAAKHAGTKGATGDRPAHARVALAREGDTLVLTVEDDGPGFQLHNVRKRSSGLGLVAGLARQLGGSFDVEPVPRQHLWPRFEVVI